MSTRDDVKRFRSLPIDFAAIEVEPGEGGGPYFCTPVGAEIVGWLGGVHFVLLPGDERVYCVDPEMGSEGTYVLPVAADFRDFLSYLLWCKCASPLSQIAWLDEAGFRRLLADNAARTWPGCEETLRARDRALALLAETFCISPKAPFSPVKALQAAFDPAGLAFSEEYYDVLGLEPPAPSL